MSAEGGHKAATSRTRVADACSKKKETIISPKSLRSVRTQCMYRLAALCVSTLNFIIQFNPKIIIQIFKNYS